MPCNVLHRVAITTLLPENCLQQPRNNHRIDPGHTVQESRNPTSDYAIVSEIVCLDLQRIAISSRVLTYFYRISPQSRISQGHTHSSCRPRCRNPGRVRLRADSRERPAASRTPRRRLPSHTHATRSRSPPPPPLRRRLKIMRSLLSETPTLSRTNACQRVSARRHSQ